LPGYHRLKGKCLACPANTSVGLQSLESDLSISAFIAVELLSFILSPSFGITVFYTDLCVFLIQQTLLRLFLVLLPLLVGIFFLFKATSVFHLSSTTLFIEFVQTTGLFLSFNLAWSPTLERLLHFFSFFTFDVDFFAPQCAFESSKSYFSRFAFQISIPMAVVTAFILVYYSWQGLCRLFPDPFAEQRRLARRASRIAQRKASDASQMQQQRGLAVRKMSMESTVTIADLLTPAHLKRKSVLGPEASSPPNGQRKLSVIAVSPAGANSPRKLRPVLVNALMVDQDAPASVTRSTGDSAVSPAAGSRSLRFSEAPPSPSLSAAGLKYYLPRNDSTANSNSEDEQTHTGASGNTQTIAGGATSSASGADSETQQVRAGSHLQRGSSVPVPGSNPRPDLSTIKEMDFETLARISHNQPLRAVNPFGWLPCRWVEHPVTKRSVFAFERFLPKRRRDQFTDALILFSIIAHIPLAHITLGYFDCYATPDRYYLVRLVVVMCLYVGLQEHEKNVVCFSIDCRV